MAEKRLTREIAEQFLADDESVDLSEFTEVDDDAAESLSMHEDVLSLNGLTSLSDAAAESLSKQKGRLYGRLCRRLCEGGRVKEGEGRRGQERAGEGGDGGEGERQGTPNQGGQDGHHQNTSTQQLPHMDEILWRALYHRCGPHNGQCHW